ncbi:hypothetical protein C2857_000994 [Epichloe festucae Fl1]|uniref:Uncharacterized protein n=1 Tax=Epichloe festucae (strain Fl1) TaxID=877507 RepID=A0A7S9KN52_EPIFF|nr:hypothetical protein C2857_000994 [Epichloe festucae Fl1]
MKTTGVLGIVITASAAISSVSSHALPMGVEIVERHGITMVREVPHELLGRDVAPRCRECVGQGGRCTVGDGSCYKEDPPLYCTYCGDRCRSVCVRQGQSCDQTCRG